MAAAGDKGNENRDQKASAQRLKRARREGQVAQSRDLSGIGALAVVLVLLALLLPMFAQHVGALWHAALRVVASPQGPAMASALALMLHAALQIAQWSLLLLLAAGLTGAALSFLQAGPVFSMQALMPRLERLDPLQQLKRLLSLRSVAQLVQHVAKLLVLGTGIVLIVWQVLGDAVRMVHGGIGGALAVLGHAVMWLGVWGVVGGLALALLDALYQRWQFERDMRMSLRELRREHREDEGDPIIKSAQRQAGQGGGASDPLRYLPLAALLIEDGQQRLVALQYRPGHTNAPVFTVRTSGLMVEVAKAMAAELRLPVVRHETMLAALWPAARPGASVPASLKRQTVALIAQHNSAIARQIAEKAEQSGLGHNRG